MDTDPLTNQLACHWRKPWSSGQKYEEWCPGKCERGDCANFACSAKPGDWYNTTAAYVRANWYSDKHSCKTTYESLQWTNGRSTFVETQNECTAHGLGSGLSQKLIISHECNFQRLKELYPSIVIESQTHAHLDVAIPIPDEMCVGYPSRYACVQSCNSKDQGHFVLARSPDFIALTNVDVQTATSYKSIPRDTVQCAGPDSTKCSWYLDSSCTILAPNEPDPVPSNDGFGGFLGMIVVDTSSYYDQWPRNASKIFYFSGMMACQQPSNPTVSPAAMPTSPAVSAAFATHVTILTLVILLF